MLILCPTFRCITHKKVSKPAKKVTNKETTVDPIRCLPVMKLTRSVFAHKRQLCPPVLSYSFEWAARLVEFGNCWHKSVDQSSIEDQDKQQIGFFVTRFTVKYSDRLFATAALKVLEFQCLKFLRSVCLSLRLCNILVQFVTFMLFSGHLGICFTLPTVAVFTF